MARHKRVPGLLDPKVVLRDFRRRELPLVRQKGPWHRIHPATDSPLWFGRTRDNRFDDVQRRYGVLYGATSFSGAFIETLGHKTGSKFVTRTMLEGRAISLIVATRPLRLVQTHGTGLARMGVDARVSSGELDFSQPFSRAIYNHPEKPDGILYRLRHDDDEFGVAIFDRAKKKLRARVLGPLRAPALVDMVAKALERYQFGLLDI